MLSLVMASLTQFEYLTAVDRFRHFKNAADYCHVSQPTLSAQLQKLEDELDIIFFDRSKKPIIPTDEGKAVIEEAKKLLAQYKRVIETVKQQKSHLAGSFHLGVIPTISPYLVPLFIQKFSQDYPSVKLIIEEYKTEDILQLLFDDQLDGGILATPLHEDKVIERVLFYEPFLAYISPRHPLSGSSEINERQLLPRDAWLLPQGHCLRDQSLHLCQHPNQEENKLVNITFTSGNLETLMRLVRDQGGFTLVPQLACSNISSQDTKAYLHSFSSPVPTREVSLVYSRSFLKENIINALEKTILSCLPTNVSSLKKQKVSVLPI